MLCAAQLPTTRGPVHETPAGQYIIKLEADNKAKDAVSQGYRPPAPKSNESTLDDLLKKHSPAAIEHSRAMLCAAQQPITKKPRSSVLDVLAKQATEAEVLRSASASLAPAVVDVNLAASSALPKPSECSSAASCAAGVLTSCLEPLEPTTAAQLLRSPAASVAATCAATTASPVACLEASSLPLLSPAGAVETGAAEQQVAAEAPVPACSKPCLKAGKGPWAIMKAIIKAKPELVGPLEDDAPHKTLGGDNSMCISAILSLDAFISGPFSPAQDPSADSFGFVPSLFSMGGSSSRSSTCSSQGSCGGLSSSQMSWSSASSSPGANSRVSRSSGGGSDCGLGRGKAQPLSGDGSVRVRVSSSDGTSPRHSVLVRVSNAGSSPSPYVSLGGAPTSSSDDLPSNGGRWAHKQPVSLASHPIKLHATYADFEAELQAKLEARRADMQRGSSSCGGGSVGEAGAARPADAFLEPDQGVQSVKEGAGSSSSSNSSQIAKPPHSHAGSDTNATHVKASAKGDFSSNSSSKAKAKGRQPARNRAAAAAPKKTPSPATPKAAGAAGGAAAASAPVAAVKVAGRRRKGAKRGRQ